MKKIILFFALIWLSFSTIAQNLQNEENQKPRMVNVAKSQTNETKPIDTLANKSRSSQLINFPQGWSSLSSYLIPENLSFDTIFLPVIDPLVMVKNLDGIYCPDNQNNTLINWNPSSGYLVKFDQPGSFVINGQEVSNLTISLDTGWSLLPVLSSCPVNVATLFQNKDVAIIKEVAGSKLYWPQKGINTLEELAVGNSYFVLMNTPADISFPVCGTTEWKCGDPLVDTRDRQSYTTVQIGTQCWMAENLNIGTMIPGGVYQKDIGTFEKYCYDNLEANCDVYGGLYQWGELMQYSMTPGVQGICPTSAGWHIPTDEEWCQMTYYLDSTVDCDVYGYSGTDAGGKMKEAGTSHWALPNAGATNSSGFTALPGGWNLNGGFEQINQFATWWTSTKTYPVTDDGGGGPPPIITASMHLLVYDYSEPEKYSFYIAQGFSVRCVKDINPASTTPTVTTSAVTGITQTTATSGGDITSDGGATVTERGICWSTNPNPTIQDSHISDGAGNGTFLSILTQLIPNTTYYVRAYATNSIGTGYGNELSFVTHAVVPWQCGDTLVDSRDNQSYPTVKIGNQCWMAKNLNVGTALNAGNYQTDNNIIEKYCFGFNPANCDVYGGLYLWDEMMQYSTTPGGQGICPPSGGWHIPTDTEWCTMTTYLDSTVDCSLMTWGTDVGGKMKETGTYHWTTPNTGATNSSGFTALPGGLYNGATTFSELNQLGFFWSSTMIPAPLFTDAYTILLYNNFPEADHFRIWVGQGASVRCVKDE